MNDLFQRNYFKRYFAECSYFFVGKHHYHRNNHNDDDSDHNNHNDNDDDHRQNATTLCGQALSRETMIE